MGEDRVRALVGDGAAELKAGWTSMTALIPFPVHDETYDRPGPPDPYGFAGWTEGDARALVYDRTNLWQTLGLDLIDEQPEPATDEDSVPAR